MGLSDPLPIGTLPLDQMASLARQCLELSVSQQDAQSVFGKVMPAEVSAGVLLASASEINSSFAELNNLLALAYEREKSYALALPYLQILRGLYPKVFDFSFRIGKIYAALENFDRAVMSFDDAIRLNGNEYWAHYERGMLYLQFERYQAAYRYFGDLIKKWPRRPQGYMRLLDAVFELREWREAVTICSFVVSNFPVMAERARLMASLANTYNALSSPSSLARANKNRACLFINLDRDDDRHEKMLNWYESIGTSIERVAGAVGSALPKAFLKSSMAKNCKEAGTIGCFLAHMKAWEVVVERNLETLILEDDAFPIYDFSHLLQSDIFPPDYDLVFVNNGMSLLPHSAGETDKLCFYAVPEVLSQRPPQQKGIGMQGYVLSPKGAQKLLNLVATDGIKGHVDWQVGAYAITASDVMRLQPDSVMSVILPHYIDATRDTPAISAYCAYPPFVKHRDYGASTRQSLN